MILGGGFYDNNRAFFKGSSVIGGLYITLYSSDVGEHSDVVEHVVVWYYIQLFSDNLGGIFGFFPSCPHRSQLQYWIKSSG